jgi:allene oxide cyclase
MRQSSVGTFAVITVALFFMPGSTAFAGGTEKLHVIEHAASDQTAHVGKADDNRGDVLTFANDVFDAANKIKVGGDQGFCIRIVTGKAYECLWTLTLVGGQITVEGPYLDAGDSVLVVTGGTGKYADVRGQMTLHSRDAKGSEYDFNYTLQHAPAH